MESLRAFYNGGDLKPGEGHSRVSRDDGTVTLCALRADGAVMQLLRPLCRNVSGF